MRNIEKYEGQKLAMVARILIENRRRREIGLNFTNAIKSSCDITGQTPPTNALINQAMSKPPKVLNKGVSVALRQVILFSSEKLGLTPHEELTIEAEADERVRTFNFGGNDRGLVADAGGVSAPTSASPMTATPPTRLQKRPSNDHLRKTVRSVAAQIGTEKVPDSQRPILGIAGHYLIVRYLFSQNEFVTSHMRIFEPKAKILQGGVRRYDFPSWFRTKGGEEFDSRDFSLVRGVIFSSDAASDSFMSIGQVETQITLRASILSRAPKPGPIVSGIGPNERDLIGLRLSLGSALREQVAHRIWCSRLPKNEHGDILRKSASTYTEDGFNKRYADTLDGFHAIKKWITAFPTMTIKPYTVLRAGIEIPREPFKDWMVGLPASGSNGGAPK